MPDVSADLTAALEQIEKRAKEARFAPALTRDWARGKSADDVPVLVAALEAVLKQADDWERQATRLAAAAGDTGHAILAEQRNARSGTLRNCARELRQDITGALAGGSGDQLRTGRRPRPSGRG